MKLADIPVEVFIDHILPVVDLRALLRLACTSKFFAALANDEMVWKRKLAEEYNFTGAGTARTSGWKFIYRGLNNPRVYVWGQKNNGRLGLDRFPRTVIRDGVPYPVELKINAKVVALEAGGMSFHALDSKGDVYVWGAMDGTVGALHMEGYTEPGKQASTPLRLQLPAATKSISCGRTHSSTLDVNNDIFTFLTWGRPFRLPMLTSANADSGFKQLECGWSFSSVLTRSGEVFIWWPFSNPISDRVREANESFKNEGRKVLVSNGDIPCAPFDIDGDVFRVLPPLPFLPPIRTSDGDSGETELIQIAGLDSNLIGLTNFGHVLTFGPLWDEAAFDQARWEYLSHFSEVDLVKSNPSFSSQDSQVEPPAELHITHITGNFRSFMAYSTGASSYVLMGDNEVNSDSLPKIIPELQNRDVISVVQGDYHSGALTSEGKLLTWGGYSSGSLGLGDPMEMETGKPGGFATAQDKELARHRRPRTPPHVDTPTEVRFDHARKKRKDRFCFAATAAGWHMGALVIDLEPDEPGDEEEEVEPEDERTAKGQPLPPYASGGLGETPPILPPLLRGRGGAFRIGYAGRGLGRGRGFGGIPPPDPS